MSLYEDYEKVLAKKKALDEIILDLQCKMYEENEFEGNSKSFTHGSFKLSIVKKENIKVDQEMASVIGLAFQSKYTLNKKAYAVLSDEDKKRVDECLTTKPGKPTFKFERIENGD